MSESSNSSRDTSKAEAWKMEALEEAEDESSESMQVGRIL